MSPATIGIAADHAGFELKEALKRQLADWGYGVLDLGTDSSQSVDYPDFGRALAEAVGSGKVRYGVAVCGTGIGISIAANRNPKVRAAVCHDVTSARLTRLHNDANIIALGARLIGPETASDCLKAFLDTKFEGGRHERRVNKLSAVS
jgi:ribose 5-phosphate isomerase B